MFTPAQLLDPLRTVQGTRNARYDCPDLAVLDRHIDHLRRRIASHADEGPDATDHYRADIDRLLDRRSWLTLPVASTGSTADRPPTSPLTTPRAAKRSILAMFPG